MLLISTHLQNVETSTGVKDMKKLPTVMIPNRKQLRTVHKYRARVSNCLYVLSSGSSVDPSLLGTHNSNVQGN